MSRRAAIINYGHGNFGSLAAALERLAITPAIWSQARDVEPVDWVILPGVGSLQDVIDQLAANGLMPALVDLKGTGVPIVGICLGMQLFFDEGEEGGSGFGWLAGQVPRLKAPILPHIGWNTVHPRDLAHPLWRNLPSEPAFYFVHSYRVAPADPGLVQATAEYIETFPAVIVAPPLFGVQFHPELSGRDGLTFLRNLLAFSTETAKEAGLS